jgi:PAS domain S-box-containing protein
MSRVTRWCKVSVFTDTGPIEESWQSLACQKGSDRYNEEHLSATGEDFMIFWRKYSLRTKVNLILLVILAGFLSISLFWQYRQQRDLTFNEAIEKARIIVAEATRTREYISQQLQVGQIELSKDRYGMIPVVVANRVGQIVADDLTYSIRHTSNRYRNPANAPDTYESEMLKRLAAEPEQHHVAEFTKLDGAPVFRYLQAAYAEESCLECHGDPQLSPLFLREIYPPEQDPAYNYRVGELIGAVSIVIPMTQLEKSLANSFNNTLFITSGFFLALVICLGLLLRTAVLNPLNSLSKTIQNISQTGHFAEPIAVRSHDEIGDLVASFNAMMSELGEKTEQLEESEKRFRLMIEIARDAIIAFLPNGQIFMFNQQAEKIFGYSQKELLGVSLGRLVASQLDLYGPSLVSFISIAQSPWFEEVHPLTGLRRDQTTVELEMLVKIVNTGDRPFYTAMLRKVQTGDAC